MNQMYKSPIEIVSKIEKQIVQQQEENVIQAIHKMGVNVDKEELLKALAYDRDQYNKGYADGAKEFAENIERYKPGIFIKGEELIIMPLCDLEQIKRKATGEDNLSKYNEIIQLYDYCRKIGVHAELSPMFDGYCMRFKNGGDVIQHMGSYGNDCGCHEFWLTNEIVCGKGRTVSEALADLYIKLKGGAE